MKEEYRGRVAEWVGTQEELIAFIEYKREKAKAFVDLGYSVEWSPDGLGYMGIYLPSTNTEEGPEVRATVKCGNYPVEEEGIDGGRIIKLDIRLIHRNILEQVRGQQPVQDVLFNYDRALDFDRLQENAEARQLHEHIIRELN